MFHNPFWENMGSKSCSNKCDEHMSQTTKHHQNGCQKWPPPPDLPIHTFMIPRFTAKMNPKRQRTSIDLHFQVFEFNISIFAVSTKNTMWYFVNFLKKLEISTEKIGNFKIEFPKFGFLPKIPFDRQICNQPNNTQVLFVLQWWKNETCDSSCARYMFMIFCSKNRNITKHVDSHHSKLRKK